jgi:integrase
MDANSGEPWSETDISDLKNEIAHGRTVAKTASFHRVKNGIPSVHPIRGDEMRALRKLRRNYPKDAYVFVSERGGPISPIGFHRLIQRLGEAAKMPFPIHPHMVSRQRARWRSSSQRPKNCPVVAT